VSAARIAPQIGPVGRWRIDIPTSAPGNSLAARSDDGANTSRHRIAGIGIQKSLVVLQRVAIDSRQIGLLRTEISHRPRSDRGSLFARHGGRWRVGRSLEEIEWRLQLRGIPRHFGTLGRLIDAKANATEQILGPNPAFPHHLCQCLGIR
jgi:hypothetical protein